MGLTIKVLEGPKVTDHDSCGGAMLTVQWQLAPGDTGYVVQHIIFTLGGHDCGTAPPKKPPTFEYYEAWKVVKGVVAASGEDYFVLEDQGEGTLGTQKIEGHVKFIPNFQLPAGFKPGSVKPAGGLPASKKAPSGWTDGTTDHTLEVTWNCCPFERSKPVVTGTPRLPADITRPTPSPRGFSGHPVVKTIHDVPPWAPASKAPAAAIEKALAPLREFNLAEIRRGMELDIAQHVSAGSYGVEEMSRLFLVNRYVLAIPEQVSRAEDRAFGGWFPPAGEPSGPLWPFSLRNGKLKLTGRFQGYAGPPYDALAEFDHFLSHGPRWRSKRRTS